MPRAKSHKPRNPEPIAADEAVPSSATRDEAEVLRKRVDELQADNQRLKGDLAAALGRAFRTGLAMQEESEGALDAVRGITGQVEDCTRGETGFRRTEAFVRRTVGLLGGDEELAKRVAERVQANASSDEAPEGRSADELFMDELESIAEDVFGVIRGTIADRVAEGLRQQSTAYVAGLFHGANGMSKELWTWVARAMREKV